MLWKSSKTQEREEENTHYLDKAVIIIKRRGKVAGKKFIFVKRYFDVVTIFNVHILAFKAF